MPRLELAYKGEPAGEYGFSRGSILTIGRAEDNALILKDTTVSWKHAKIESSPAGYLLTDLGSTNGTLVNNVRVETRWLDHGDVLTMGRTQLVFLMSAEELLPGLDTLSA
jgi:pSer/pThr/pTyr-binding forkhead associated (FHA) protein